MQAKISLEEIAEWQINAEQSEVELPLVQRGFVWKPHQVENLWDSLLRGYPIGSFLLSGKSNNKYFLMDGQQRATSIFLGYYNPFDTNKIFKTWSIKEKLPVLWIDIQPDKKPQTSKYLLRLITRSHPWGYKAEKNEERLDISDRREALELFKKNPANNGGYTTFDNTTVFPFDACYPLPLAFFIASEKIEEVIAMSEKYLPDYFRTKRGGFKDKEDFLDKLKSDVLSEKSKAILETVKKTIKEKSLNYDIVDESVLKEENEKDDDPTLFIRINKAGTPLGNDDLIYAIYKAKFPESKQLVEEIGCNFLEPTQVISLASRIANSSLNDNSFTSRMKVIDFQRKLKQEGFIEKLNYQIDENHFKDLFEKAIGILSCKNNSLFEGEIPPVLIKNFIKHSQELFYVLLYWLYKNEIKDIQTELKITAKLFLFSWFGKDNNKFVRDCWKEFLTCDFWEQAINKHLWDRIHFIIPPDLLRHYYLQPEIENSFLDKKENRWGLWEIGTGREIIQYFNKSKSQEFDFKTANDYFWRVIDKVKSTKLLILLAQREHINSTFTDYNQMNEIEDTNVPWDWDHIYPQNWVYWQKVDQIFKDWNNTNGNYRAISLEQNRRRGDKQSPKDISDEKERENSFIQPNDWHYWEQIDERINDKEKTVNYIRAITTRMINIYEKFWYDLKIGDLINNQGI